MPVHSTTPVFHSPSGFLHAIEELAHRSAIYNSVSDAMFNFIKSLAPDDQHDDILDEQVSITQEAFQAITAAVAQLLWELICNYVECVARTSSTLWLSICLSEHGSLLNKRPRVTLSHGATCPAWWLICQLQVPSKMAPRTSGQWQTQWEICLHHNWVYQPGR